MRYETSFGESLCVVGNIAAIGNWKEFKAHMKWTEGHIWELKNLDIEAKDAVFQYKYVVLNHGKPSKWEDGINRIADLHLLAAENEGRRTVELRDHFERYTVNFSIHYPLKEGEFMRINGDPEIMGFWNKGTGPKKMAVAQKEVVWLTGEKVHPWEFPVMFRQNEIPNRIIYKYSIRNEKKDTYVWEREPSRVLEVPDPNEYQG